MITKTRFTSSRIVVLSLTASLFSMTAQADVIGANTLAIPAGLASNQNLLTSNLLSAPPSGTFATSLGNVGQAVDNVTPFRLRPVAIDIGATLDSEVNMQDIQRWSDRVMEAIDLRRVTDDTGKALDLAGNNVDLLGELLAQSSLPLEIGPAAGKLLYGVGGTVSSVGDFLRNPPDNPYFITNTLNHLTSSLANATDALAQGGFPLQAGDGLLNGLVGSNATNTNLLAPVTNLVSGLTGGLGSNDVANTGLLAPVTNVVSGLTGGLGNNDTANAGVLAPVTNLVNGLLSGGAH
ncbi:hypothetical protein NIZ92_14180 [Alcaligenes sp. 1735tsa3]|uniref:hypothetical protein n=1 Tax=Alcaligenes sp. 1735tsa3 TaxID=2953809 RepID=UPI0020A7F951|nr:hypothetical protein [Alcaligenes sp. 1735tsa3]USY24450.1 hypothetical protein NIZ92_14180 [Alcaligenes sp. 1735tsa3]